MENSTKSRLVSPHKQANTLQVASNSTRSTKVDDAQKGREKRLKQGHLEHQQEEIRKLKTNLPSNRPSEQCKLCRDFIKDIRQKSERLAKLEIDRKHERDRRKRREKELEEVKNKLKKRNSELKSVKDENLELQTTISELRKCEERKNIESLQTSVKDLNNQVNSKNLLIDSQQNLIAELEDRLKALAPENTDESQKLQKKVKEMENEMEQQNKRLSEAAEIMKQQQSFLKDKNEKIKILEEQNQDIPRLESSLKQVIGEMAIETQERNRLMEFIEQVKSACLWKNSSDRMDDLLAHIKKQMVLIYQFTGIMEQVARVSQPEKLPQLCNDKKKIQSKHQPETVKLPVPASKHSLPLLDSQTTKKQRISEKHEIKKDHRKKVATAMGLPAKCFDKTPSVEDGNKTRDTTKATVTSQTKHCTLLGMLKTEVEPMETNCGQTDGEVLGDENLLGFNADAIQQPLHFETELESSVVVHTTQPNKTDGNGTIASECNISRGGVNNNQEQVKVITGTNVKVEVQPSLEVPTTGLDYMGSKDEDVDIETLYDEQPNAIPETVQESTNILSITNNSQNAEKYKQVAKLSSNQVAQHGVGVGGKCLCGVSFSSTDQLKKHIDLRTNSKNANS